MIIPHLSPKKEICTAQFRPLDLIPAMITDQAWCPLSAFLHVYNCCKKSPDLLTIGWSAFVKVLQDLKFKYLSIYFENKLKNLCSHMMKSMQYTIHIILKYKDDISPNRTTTDTKWGMRRGVVVKKFPLHQKVCPGGIFCPKNWPFLLARQIWI